MGPNPLPFIFTSITPKTMNRSNRNIVLTALAALFLNLSFLNSVTGQPPPPPAGDANNGHSISTKASDAAPVGEGIWILMTLALSYGIFMYIRKSEINPDDLQTEDLNIVTKN
jgi:hypothetical protein